ncbi:MAG: hypothetical protein Sylvanvirus8_21 [Sylvanvirus sp.]|uniref:DUF7796 domain-containing protein n=1 Tax=Sylvanvirus sp. TaxID=2487774 RepID=A0A3G5AHS7_9VIRU|nr:MAG: hypothetical protein Sylvanvirus8_21 [Sylvanvirus sp.]
MSPRRLFFLTDTRASWEEDYILELLRPVMKDVNQYEWIVKPIPGPDLRYFTQTSDMIGWCVLAFSSNNVKPENVIALCRCLRPKIIFHLSDEWGQQPEFLKLAKFTHLYLRQHNFAHYPLSSFPNAFQIPLGYMKGMFPRNEPVDMFTKKPIALRKYVWSFVGAMKSDRQEMIDCFANAFPIKEIDESEDESEDQSEDELEDELHSGNEMSENEETQNSESSNDSKCGSEESDELDESNNNDTSSSSQHTSSLRGYGYVGNGMSPEAMREIYNDSVFVLSGRGNISLDCFRLYEATLSGAIPVAVGTKQELKHTFSFANNPPPFITADTWPDALKLCQDLLLHPSMVIACQQDMFNWMQIQIFIIQFKIQSALLQEFKQEDDVDELSMSSIDSSKKLVAKSKELKELNKLYPSRESNELTVSAKEAVSILTLPLYPSTPIALFDCVPYNGEPIVEERLKQLYPYVDKFYITEARYTFSGIRKPELYVEKNRHVFERYMNKIEFLVIEQFPDIETSERNMIETRAKMNQIHCVDIESWFRENYQRDYVQQILQQKQQEGLICDPFVCVVCDVDEIPRAAILQDLKKPEYYYDRLCKTPRQTLYLQMDFYYYNWNWKKKSPWMHPFCTTTIQESFSDKRWNAHFHARSLDRTILNSGWHLSYFMPKEDLVRKITSFAHREFDQDQFKSSSWLDVCLCAGKDLFGRGTYEDLVRTNIYTPVLLTDRDDVSLPPRDSGWNYGGSHRSVDEQLRVLFDAIYTIRQPRKAHQILIIDAVQEKYSNHNTRLGGSYTSISSFLDLQVTSQRLRTAFPHQLEGFQMIDRTQFTTHAYRMNVKEAWYGRKDEHVIDVSMTLSWISTNNILHIPTGFRMNSCFGQDPCPEKPKFLYVSISFPDLSEQLVIDLQFPEDCPRAYQLQPHEVVDRLFENQLYQSPLALKTDQVHHLESFYSCLTFHPGEGIPPDFQTVVACTPFIFCWQIGNSDIWHDFYDLDKLEYATRITNHMAIESHSDSCVGGSQLPMLIRITCALELGKRLSSLVNIQACSHPLTRFLLVKHDVPLFERWIRRLVKSEYEIKMLLEKISFFNVLTSTFHPYVLDRRTSPRVAICYFGMLRSLKSVVKTHQRHLFSILRNQGYSTDIFMHTWKTNQGNRVWEQHVASDIDYEEYKVLLPDYYQLDDQDEFTNTLSVADYFDQALFDSKGCCEGGEWLKDLVWNHICALESQRRVYQMVTDSMKSTGIEYEYVFIVRPDTFFHQPFPIEELKNSEYEEVLLRNCEHYGGYNDRFAVGRYDVMGIYTGRLKNLKSYRKTQKRIVAEEYLKYTLDRRGVRPKFIEFPFNFIRPSKTNL